MNTIMTVAALDVVRAVRTAFRSAGSNKPLTTLGEQEILDHLVRRNVIPISMIKNPDMVMISEIAGTVCLPGKVVRGLKAIGLEFLTDLQNVTYHELMERDFADAALIAKLQEGLALFDMGLKGPAPAE